MKSHRTLRKHSTSYSLTSLTRPLIVALILFVLAVATVVSYVAVNRNESNGTTAANPALGTNDAGDFSQAPFILGVVVDQNLHVVDVDPGSVAEQAGVRRGDILTAVAGTAVSLPNVAKQAVRRLSLATVGQRTPVALMLTRNGQAVTVQVVPYSQTPRKNQPTATAVPSGKGLDYL